MGLPDFRHDALPWQRLLRPGDWAAAISGLLVVLISIVYCWIGLTPIDGPAQAVVRQDGRITARLPLDAHRRLSLQGPLGETLIETAPGQARVAADPGPQQTCVHQGWLQHLNSVALCLPSRLSLTVENGRRSYDTLGY